MRLPFVALLLTLATPAFAQSSGAHASGPLTPAKLRELDAFCAQHPDRCSGAPTNAYLCRGNGCCPPGSFDGFDNRPPCSGPKEER